MGVFSRFLDIVNANINSLLDRAEDPQKMLRMMIQEMEDTLIEIKSNCAAKMASRAKVERQYREVDASIKRWEGRAQLAVDKGRDDLAKEALLEKKRALLQMARLKEELAGYDNLIKDSRNEIDQLDDKLSEVKKKYQLLMEKVHQEQEKEHTQEAMKMSPLDHFNSMEEKIDRMQARNDINASKPNLEKEFSNLESEEDIETQLNELRKNREKN
ncbi:MAG: PspA/IM30 family protein [Sphaerochaetaceae bacterium]